jgi:hypothetical protein
MVSSRTTEDSYALKGFSHRSEAAKDSKPRRESDGDSDFAILEENRSRGQGSDDEILKTTRVSVTVDDKASGQDQGSNWV